MKTFNEYLSTKINNKFTDIFDNGILDGIDVSKWSWKLIYSQSNYMNTFKENVKEFARSETAKQLYPNTNKPNILEKLYRDTYRAYLSTSNRYSEEELDRQYDSQIKCLDRVLKETGWGQFEYSCLEQGWWAFMSWVIDQKYNKN